MAGRTQSRSRNIFPKLVINHRVKLSRHIGSIGSGNLQARAAALAQADICAGGNGIGPAIEDLRGLARRRFRHLCGDLRKGHAFSASAFFGNRDLHDFTLLLCYIKLCTDCFWPIMAYAPLDLIRDVRTFFGISLDIIGIAGCAVKRDFRQSLFLTIFSRFALAVCKDIAGGIGHFHIVQLRGIAEDGEGCSSIKGHTRHIVNIANAPLLGFGGCNKVFLAIVAEFELCCCRFYICLYFK